MPDHFYIYPAYLSGALPRRLGRRVPAAVAVPDVTLEEIVQAARRLGLSATAEEGKQYSRRAHAYEGRVKVAKRAGTSKTAALRSIAQEIRRHRPASGKR